MSNKDWYSTSGRLIDAIPEELQGNNELQFVYRLDLKDGGYYYGKKKCYMRATSPRKADGTEREHHICWNRSRTHERYLYEKWKNYEGSNYHPFTSEIKQKVILYWCKTSRSATLLEAKLILQHFGDPLCRNENILGKFYHRDYHQDNFVEAT